MGQLSMVAGAGAAAAKQGTTDGVLAKANQVSCLSLVFNVQFSNS